MHKCMFLIVAKRVPYTRIFGARWTRNFLLSKFLSWYQKCASALCTFKKTTNFGKENEEKKDLLDVPCTHYFFADSECTYVIWTKTKIGFRVRHFTTTCLLFKNPIITFRRSTIYYYQSLFYMFFTTYIF